MLTSLVKPGCSDERREERGDDESLEWNGHKLMHDECSDGDPCAPRARGATSCAAPQIASDPAPPASSNPSLTTMAAASTASPAEELAGLDRVLNRLATTEDTSLEKASIAGAIATPLMTADALRTPACSLCDLAGRPRSRMECMGACVHARADRALLRCRC